MSRRVIGKPRTIGVVSPIAPSPMTPDTVSPSPEPKNSLMHDVINEDPQLASPFHLSTPDIHTPDIILSDADIFDGVTPTNEPDNNQSEDQKQQELANEVGSFACPICNEVMVTLLQLNRHIDDLHSAPSSPPIKSPNEEIKSWLKKTSKVGSKLQTALPKKFANFDIFDTSMDSSRDSSNSSLVIEQPDIIVTKRHWVKPKQNQSCSMIDCKKKLNVKNGIVNCRKCGKLYCNQHTLFRIKLDQIAKYDTLGIWSRCCEVCYKNKPGYNDFGTVRDLSLIFNKKRQTKSDETQLYENKLQKRIINMSKTFSSIDYELKNEQFFVTFKSNQKKKEAEQKLVHWENEQSVLSCFICCENFSFKLRKHHCRLCGKVVCGSEKTNCSREVPFYLLSQFINEVSNDPYPIRICHECEDVFTIKKEFLNDLKKPLSPLLVKFDQQQKIKIAILFLLPKFQKLIQTLQHSNKLNDDIIKEASKQRKRLVDSFAQFDKLTKEMITLPLTINDEIKLQTSIKSESFAFIQKNMAPLKQLPKLLKDIEKKQKENEPVKLSHSQIQQIKKMREELMVLNEQKFLVEEMISNSKKQRKFDEINTLEQNLEDLNKMIQDLQVNLGNEGF